MAAKALLTSDAYLRTSFENPDKEFRDGELVDRAMPDNPHSRMQCYLIAFFYALRRTARLYPRPSMRVKLRDGLYRVRDISVFHGEEPTESVPTHPPLVAIEILSPDDSMSEVRHKLQEYSNWGVAHVWLIDPHSQRLYTCDGELREVRELTIPELGITVPNAELFE